MLLFLEVHCTFLLVVTNCGKNTALRCSNSIQFKLTSFQHSVVNAKGLRFFNPNAEKYLVRKKLFNDIEWICQSCDKSLEKNKIPPCAAENGMSFPVKPVIFVYTN